MICKCGCGREVPMQKTGRPGEYYSGACRVRYHRQKSTDVTKVETVPSNVTKLPEIKPILKYPGAKWSQAQWVVSHFPAHRKYLEPYCGSAAAFFSKDRVPHEVL